MAALLRSAGGSGVARYIAPPIVSAWSGASALRQPLLGLHQRRWHSVTTGSGSGSGSGGSSVNPDEVARFTALASDWWDPHGAARALHLMNPLRHDFIQSCLRQSPPLDAAAAESLSYLDIGGGGGIFAESAARLPSTKHVTAIDPTSSLLAVAKAHAQKDPSLARKLTYKNCSLEQLDTPQPGGRGEYDIVSLFEVLEHVDEPRVLLERVRPFVKPGGWLVMSTIARTWASWFVTILVAETITGVVPRGTHDWAKYIDSEELHGFLADNKGWDSPRVMGVVYVPGLGWKVVSGSEKIGNYFFAVRREPLSQG